MKLPVWIRDLTLADVDAVAALASSLAEAPHWPPEVYAATLQPDALPRRIVLVAEIEESDPAGLAVVGLAVALPIPPEAELESIAVAAHMQRRGVGDCLLAALLERLRLLQVRELNLEVRASNQAAQGFYRVHGFVQVGVRPAYYANPNEDAQLMRLRIS